ncbi:MAG: pantoate--beta-alanine ligase [Firmicutes bacterium]|nr:pantoate--beta-alanine ligase [Bacillota bacterium]
MKIIKSIKEMKDIIKQEKTFGKTIGLVPTMGFLHEGHLSLIRTSSSKDDIIIVSIFVNPTQFGPNEDYDKYPRDLKRDVSLAEDAGADLIFAPDVEEMYPQGYKTYVNVENITEVLCGKSRPGHFRGVTTVVAKLFNIIQPDRAYFGLKDAQQYIVIKKMVEDLNMNLEVVPCPIVREADGLAMSSRNIYLSIEERKAALILSKSLFEAEDMVKSGERNAEKILERIYSIISSEKLANIDYIEAVNADTLEKISEIKGKVLIALAVKIGNTRLIDNIIVEV